MANPRCPHREQCIPGASRALGHCENESALSALRLGHVRWGQLHPAVRERLEASGYHAGSFVDCTGRASHLRPLQHNERWPGRQR